MSKRASPALIGAFVVGAAALAVVAVLVIGSGRYFADTYPFILYFPGQVDGLRVGAAVKFKGVQIGSVTKIMLRYEQPEDNQNIPVFIELDETKIATGGGPSELDPENIGGTIDRGLRAQLQTESLLTGLLFVQLDLLPDTPAEFVGLDKSLLEIPTLPTTLEQIQTTVRRVLERLEKIDFDELTDNLEETVASLNKLLSSPVIEETIASLDETLTSVRRLSDTATAEIEPLVDSFTGTSDRARQTLEELEATLKSTRSVLAPDSPLAYQLARTLEEFSLAARSVRDLANTLERNPSVLLRGREAEGRNK